MESGLGHVEASGAISRMTWDSVLLERLYIMVNLWSYTSPHSECVSSGFMRGIDTSPHAQTTLSNDSSHAYNMVHILVAYVEGGAGSAPLEDQAIRFV